MAVLAVLYAFVFRACVGLAARADLLVFVLLVIGGAGFALAILAVLHASIFAVLLASINDIAALLTVLPVLW